MRIRLPGIGLVVMMALAAESFNSISAQGETPSGSTSVNVQSAPAETVARIHWIGTDQLGRDTNAAHLIGICKIPVSAKLQAQMLDKLSAAPWRLLHRPSDTNGAALVRPLLEDVLHRECYLQARQAPGQPVQIAFAIRLDDRRAALWRTNLAAVLESLTGIQPVNAKGAAVGWSLKKHHAPNLIELSQVGEWTVLGAAADRNPLFAELVSRIRRDRAPFGAEVTRDWLQADLDLARLPAALSTNWSPRPDWPRISMTAVEEGTNLHTRAEIHFANLPPVELDAWKVPTTIMNEPQVSFTAARGFKNWLESLTVWKDLHIGPAPNQVFAWGLYGEGMNTYAAAPLLEASNEVYKLTDFVLQKWGPSFATNEIFKFTKAETYNGLEWHGFPWVAPALESVAITNGNFVLGRLFPNMPTMPRPPGYYDKALAGTNLIYYGWEFTGPRVQQWLFLGQCLRLVSQKPQMPFKCASLEWLHFAGPLLGTSITRITTTGPGQFSFDRTSITGFTAIELHLIADWLESPQFPIGLHTFLSPPDK